MKVIFNIIGWRDPSYMSCSSEGYGEWNTPRPVEKDLTIEEINDLEQIGMISHGKKDICIDHEMGMCKYESNDMITYNYCVLYLPREEE